MLLSCLKNGLSLAWHSAAKPETALQMRQAVCIADVCKRHESNYNAYPTFDTPSPYKPTKGIRRMYEYKYYAGGDKNVAFFPICCCCPCLYVRHLANFISITAFHPSINHELCADDTKLFFSF